MPVQRLDHLASTSSASAALRLTLGALCLAALTACGGGDGGGGSSAEALPSPGATVDTNTSATDTGALASSGGNTTTTTTTTTPPVTQVAGVSAGPGECGLPDFRASLLKLLNEKRAAGAVCGATVFAPGAAALVWNNKLTQSALGHSQDMATRDYFQHNTLNGATWDARITAAGYVWRTAGENIAQGHQSADEVVVAWMGSEGHCRVIMNPAFVDVGAACVAAVTRRTNSASVPSMDTTYWTLDAGAPK